jgi:hypothetical protein
VYDKQRQAADLPAPVCTFLTKYYLPLLQSGNGFTPNPLQHTLACQSSSTHGWSPKQDTKVGMRRET